MDVYTILVLAHIVGTVLGVGGATFAEVNLIRALQDGEVTPDESNIMKAAYSIIRIGLFLLVVSGFGFLILARLEEYSHILYSMKLWAKLSIVGILAANAGFLQMRLVSLRWGSAISIVSWYAALFLGVVRGGGYSYVGIMAIYAVTIVATYLILSWVHDRYTAPHRA